MTITTCPVHAVTLAGCPHPNPADTYRGNTQYTITHYHWLFQRYTDGAWLYGAGDPRGDTRSDYTPQGFARHILTQHAPDGSEPWRLAIWGDSGVSREPVYTITSEQAEETP